MSCVLAVDVGGSKLAAALVDTEGAILHRAQAPTPVGADSMVLADVLESVVRRVLDPVPLERVTGLGVGSAGPLDPLAGTVSPVNIPAWRGFPILKILAEVLPGRPAALAGDGHCMALGEYRFGGDGSISDAGAPAGGEVRAAGGSHPASRALLGMVVSTGVGGGFVFDGRMMTGPTGNAGHIGHIVVDLAGPICPCGSRGCVEVLASGPNIVRWALAQGWVGPPDGRAVAASARAGDPLAKAAFERAATALAAGIVSATALVDLDDVVIGGGVAQAGDVLFVPLRAALAALAGLDFIRRVRVRPSVLGATAGLLGAAALAFDPPPH
jgi:glucokinase